MQFAVPLHQVVEVTRHQPQLQQLKKRLKSRFTALSNITSITWFWSLQGSGCTCWICSWRWRCKYQISLLCVHNSRLDVMIMSFRMELPLQLMRMTMRPNLWEVVKWSQPLMKVVWNKSTSNVALEELKLVKFSKKAWNFLSKWCSDDDLIYVLLIMYYYY